MRYNELKRRIEEYLACDMSEFKEKGDQGEGLFVTHMVKNYKIKRIIDHVINTKRQMIESAIMTSDMQMAETVCLHISTRLVNERYHDICHNQGIVHGNKIDIKTATDILNYAFTTLGLDVTLDGRDVIDKYYKLNDSKKTDDTNSILELHIPHGSSNGDVFKAVFPDTSIMFADDKPIYVGLSKTSDESWWDKPYVGIED